MSRPGNSRCALGAEPLRYLLEDTVEQLGAQLSPVLVRRMQDKLWQALYFGYDYAAPFLSQLEKKPALAGC